MSVATNEALNRELPVLEIFRSIQGEGSQIGQLCDFVRLAGCNMNPPCTWCDTAYAQNPDQGQPMTVGQIVDTCTAKQVVITGGEPLRHARIEELCDQLYRRGQLVTVETNGTLYRDDLRWSCYLLSVSPKLPSSGHTPNIPVLERFVRTANHFVNTQIKFVIGSTEDFQQAIETMTHLVNAWSENEVIWIFQPMTELAFDMELLLEHTRQIVERSKNIKELWERSYVRVLPQLHKFLWGNRRMK